MNRKYGQAWWCMSSVPAFKNQKQEVSLVYILSSKKVKTT